jgi:hypothetical protein
LKPNISNRKNHTWRVGVPIRPDAGALASAKRHKIDQRGWDSLLTQYVLGTYCEKQRRNRLFTFIPSLKKDAIGVIVDVVVDVKEIPPGELVVLGIENFGDRARKEYQRAFEAKDDAKRAMFAFLNTAIDEVQSNGDLKIDHPSVLKAFSCGDLTELGRQLSKNADVSAFPTSSEDEIAADLYQPE